MPRISIRMLLVAVAVTALLIPFPIKALWLLAPTFLVLVMPPIILILIVDSRGYRGASLATALVIAVIASYFQSRFYAGPIHPDRLLFTWFTASLTPINLAGPLVMVKHYWRGRPLASGEILWAWMGLVWLVFLGPGLQLTHGGWQVSLEMLVEFAQLTSVITLLLAFYGKRPSSPDPVWAHRIGWAVAECDVIAWGWYALS